MWPLCASTRRKAPLGSPRSNRAMVGSSCSGGASGLVFTVRHSAFRGEPQRVAGMVGGDVGVDDDDGCADVGEYTGQRESDAEAATLPISEPPCGVGQHHAYRWARRADQAPRPPPRQRPPARPPRAGSTSAPQLTALIVSGRGARNPIAAPQDRAVVS